MNSVYIFLRRDRKISGRHEFGLRIEETEPENGYVVILLVLMDFQGVDYYQTIYSTFEKVFFRLSSSTGLIYARLVLGKASN